LSASEVPFSEAAFAAHTPDGNLTAHDPVTGLPGRFLLQSHLEHALEHARRHGHPLAVLLIALDDLQRVNHALGYPSGDHVLREAGLRLQTRIRKEDTFGRLYGGKFLLLLEHLHEVEEAAHVARDLLQTLSTPFSLDTEQLIFQSACIGISFYPNDGADAASLIRLAEIALLRAREQGHGQFGFHARDLDTDAHARMTLESSLCAALKNNELELFFQPKTDLHNGLITGAEALLRWRRGDTLVPPGQFIPLAEKSGLIVPIGIWVIDTACARLRAWADQGQRETRLAVNVSARQFHTGNLDTVVAEALARHDVEPARLELELTESMLMDNPEATTTLLQRLKAIGVRLSLDDFGTGYSCLAYLARFPIDTLKVDQSFVRDMVHSSNTAGIVTAIISLARTLHLHVVAEGVETPEQLGYLRKLGCDEVQGYLLGRPMPESAWLATCDTCSAFFSQEHTHQAEQTLLLVDDEPGILSALKRMLRNEGWRILTAQNGEQGLDILAREAVQVIVSDHRMPGLSGCEFLARVKAMHPDCLRIMLSGQADMHAVLDAINNGAVYKFFTKPWDDQQLRERLREAFRIQAALTAAKATLP